MNFTLFLNSRGRVAPLANFLESVKKTTKNLKEIEIIIRGDSDDKETLDLFKTLSFRNNTFEFRPLIGDRPTSLCASFNVMANMGKGKYLFVMNDDVEILTPNWDIIALEKIQAFQKENGIKDDIIFGETSDTSVDKPVGQRYASFPIISKQAVDVLGFFMHEQFVGLGGDSAIQRVYEGAKRIVDLREIQVDHLYHNTVFKVLSPDKTAHEMRMNSNAHALNPFTFDVDKDILKLKNYIEKVAS